MEGLTGSAGPDTGNRADGPATLRYWRELNEIMSERDLQSINMSERTSEAMRRLAVDVREDLQRRYGTELPALNAPAP